MRAADSRLRVLVGVVGLAGHALPAIALARELRVRGHEVRLHTEGRWRETAEGLGLEFAGGERHIVPLPAAVDGASEPSVAEIVRALLPSLEDLRPDVVVGDALTLTPSLAAELAGVPRVTLFPEVYPVSARGLPLFSLGLFPPRTTLGAAAWRAAGPALATRLPTTRWLRWSQRRLNEQRAELGLPPQPGVHGPAGEGPALVATLPQLEYPRAWPPGVHVTGPMAFDPPHPEVALPAGDDPLILVAPSTVKDPEGRLVRTALAALEGEPLRLVVTMSGASPRLAGPMPANAVIADWVDYSQLMGEASLVVCHGTHGTVVRALAEGVPVLAAPAMPDDAEHGARVAWAGAGLMVPKPLLGARALRAATRRLLADPRFAARAGEIAASAREHDGAARGADLVEAHART